MATILFAAAGAALGSGLGGTILGMSGAILGRAAGATLGRAIDQRILGGGSDAVEVGRIDRFQITGASQGASVPQVWGRTRVAGQIIWASPFKESRARRGGKGMPSPKVTQYSYSVSLAIALCEGEILGVGRIWADGSEIKHSTLSMRVYCGTEMQLPDPIIESFEGNDCAPAYRGIAYLVFENLDLSVFGNRIPQFSFEVMRRAIKNDTDTANDLQDSIRAVALIPGTGEYAYSVKKQNIETSFEFLETVNVHTPSGDTDFSTSINQLTRELPNCGAVSLVISWFGDDLRCSNCKVQPKVEQKLFENPSKPWRAGGISRHDANEVPRLNGRSIYGGTPSDDTVVDAIRNLKSRALEVMFYPFVLMDQIEGNTLRDPYTDKIGQPPLPWRGRITLSSAPGQPNSPDETFEAENEVESFFGNAKVEDFSIIDDKVVYSGTPDWGYRHFIIHYAYLCRIAGGVEAFCIGSELRGITTIRGANESFPAVQQLIRLLIDVRSILDPSVKISYAADWSEYFGYHVSDHVYFHLDPLWSRPEIDFIGVDYYVPVSDWRSTVDHKDSTWGSNYRIDYIKANINGGEGYDWFYADLEAEVAQLRTPIFDAAYGEHWVYRPKDLTAWWSNLHFERRNGIKLIHPTAWLPQSKPFRFTEYGCAAIDKGTNQPNRFLDARSSESSLPRDSLGIRDDLIQLQFYRAMTDFWKCPKNNPVSDVYSGSMLDNQHCYAWAWDIRPYPDFPRNEQIWSDGKNYYYGHWLNGRSTSVALDVLLEEICSPIVREVINTKDVFGSVLGYSVLSTQTARSKIQPLAQVFSFDVADLEGSLSFASRDLSLETFVCIDHVVEDARAGANLELTRIAHEGIPDCVRFSFIESDGNFTPAVTEVSGGISSFLNAYETELPVVLHGVSAKAVAARWLSELSVGKDSIAISLPLSYTNIKVGSNFVFDNKSYRVEYLEYDKFLSVKGVASDRLNYSQFQVSSDVSLWDSFLVDSPIKPFWLELPLFLPDQSTVSPFIAISANSFRSRAVLWTSNDDSNYEVNAVFNSLSWVGRTSTSLFSCQPGVMSRVEDFCVRMPGAPLSNISRDRMLTGGNRLAIGDGSNKKWEIIQFCDAELLPSGLWRLGSLLRGQNGSDANMPDCWPAGSVVVFLDEGVAQAQIADDLRGVEQHCRIAFEGAGLDDESSSYSIQRFSGVGLIPLSVCHLRLVKGFDLEHEFTWKRRSRLDSDSWDGYEAALGEDRELYSFKIFRDGGEFVREVILEFPSFQYSMHARLSDNILGSYYVEVCQISFAVGLGYSKRMWVT